MRIVGVHGVGNYRPNQTPEEVRRDLGSVWHRHLLRGAAADLVRQSEVSVTYYAHHLAPRGIQGVDDSVDRLPAEVRELVEVWLETLVGEANGSQGWATRPLRQTLGWLAQSRRLGKPAVEKFVCTFFREVATYLAADGSVHPARRAAQEEVADEIRRKVPQVVIAHSLGSVVAYEALWAHPDIHVDLFLTVGSPLALPHAVLHRLEPAAIGAGRGARPPGVRKWVNIADPGDLVAIPRGAIPRHFAQVEPEDAEKAIHAFDFHKAANYLACAATARALSDLGPGRN